MSPIQADALQAALEAGHIGHLTPDQTSFLKKFWQRLFEQFKQPGDPNSKPRLPRAGVAAAAAAAAAAEASPAKKSGFFSSRSKEPEPEATELFLGATTDPKWLSEPLEKAIPLIPGTELERAFWNMVGTDNADALLLRFCRARKWEFDDAYNMLLNALRWRLVNRIDDLILLGETGIHDVLESLKPGMGDSFISNLNSGKAYLAGPDKDNRGVCFINVRFHHKEDQDMETLKLLTMYVMESAQMTVNQPMESVCIVFNLEGFTLSNMDFEFVKFLVTCFEAYYPETLGQCLIHKAPWVFSTVWVLIAPLLDPVVASKVHFTKNVQELTNYVPAPSLPSFISGDEKKKSKYEAMKVDAPKAGSLSIPSTPAVQDYREQVKQFVSETVTWVKTDIGADDESRLGQARRLRHARIKADPDCRGPSTWELKSLLSIKDGRLILDFGNDGWVPLDITDKV